MKFSETFWYEMKKPKREAERQAEICKQLLRNVNPFSYILFTHSLTHNLNEIFHTDLF